jgi:hypothetical protein
VELEDIHEFLKAPLEYMEVLRTWQEHKYSEISITE